LAAAALSAETRQTRGTVDQITQRRRASASSLDERLSEVAALIAPQTARGKVYLIDIRGAVAHEW
jgi:hypothetical protein